MMKTELKVKIYYEDTDSLGVVYHANYLKYFERARTELLESKGKPISEWNAEGYNFAVYEMRIKFRQAARLGGIYTVVTEPQEGGGEYRARLKQTLQSEDGSLVTEAEVDLVCVDHNFRLIKFPSGIFEV